MNVGLQADLEPYSVVEGPLVRASFACMLKVCHAYIVIFAGWVA